MVATPAIAVKAFIVRNRKALVLRRGENDAHAPGRWDIPGGRLSPGENPVKGLEREVFEETGLRVKVGPLMGLHHFRRDDGQIITMLVFLCAPKGGKTRLSAEHVEAAWLDLKLKGTKEKLDVFAFHADDYLETFSKLKGNPKMFHFRKI
jgi:8-oxo-dGTP diphosphatase